MIVGGGGKNIASDFDLAPPRPTWHARPNRLKERKILGGSGEWKNELKNELENQAVLQCTSQAQFWNFKDRLENFNRLFPSSVFKTGKMENLFKNSVTFLKRMPARIYVGCDDARPYDGGESRGSSV